MPNVLATAQQKLGQSKWSNILKEISDWLKLLALIVLVAQGIILAAMFRAPQEDSPLPYLLAGLSFLTLLIVGWGYDRFLSAKGQDQGQIAPGIAKQEFSQLLGRAEMYERAAESIAAANESIIDTTWFPGPEGPPKMTKAQERARRRYRESIRGVVTRVPIRELVGESRSYLEESRSLSSLPDSDYQFKRETISGISYIPDFMVVDGTHGILSHVSGGGHPKERFVYFDSKILGGFLTEWFDTVWRGAGEVNPEV